PGTAPARAPGGRPPRPRGHAAAPRRRQRRGRAPCPRPAQPPRSAPPASGAVPSEAQPAFVSLRAWLAASLGTRHASQWLLTRLALLLVGLLAGQEGSVNGIARTVKAQHVTSAKRPSIRRRVQ